MSFGLATCAMVRRCHNAFLAPPLRRGALIVARRLLPAPSAPPFRTMYPVTWWGSTPL